MKSVCSLLAATCALAWSVAQARDASPETPQAAAQTDGPDAESGCSGCTISLETWLYATHTRLSARSLLNPGNRIATIPENQGLIDTRLNLHAEIGPVELVGASRLVVQRDMAGGQTAPDSRRRISNTASDVLWNQGFARFKRDGDTLVVGREALTWGPATFRSPSNPWYFDSGRTSPLAATPGIDLLRYTHGFSNWHVTTAYVASAVPTKPGDDVSHAQLLKVDQQGQSYLVSVNVARLPGASNFIGGFGQFTPSDAWLLYGEFGASSRPAPSGRTALAGASYTLESGRVLTGEWLYNDGGFTRGGQTQYFEQAAKANAMADVSPAAGLGLLGQTLAQAPRLMGRNYVWTCLQSNPQDSALYWRTELTGNLTDYSTQTSIYLEKNILSKASGFIVATRNTGSPQTDFGALVRTSVTVGIKLFVF